MIKIKKIKITGFDNPEVDNNKLIELNAINTLDALNRLFFEHPNKKLSKDEFLKFQKEMWVLTLKENNRDMSNEN